MWRTFEQTSRPALRLQHVAWAFAMMVAAHGRPGTAAPPAAFVLDLPDGGVLPGEFATFDAVDGSPRETFRWKAAPFVEPFEFRIDAITGIRAATSAKEAGKPAGFRCRLRGGDIIDGSLEGIDGEVIVLRPTGSDEPVRIDRRLVASIRRRGRGEGTGYVGPGSLVGWKQSPAGSWRDDAARLSSEVRNASISQDLSAPERARYDVALSWRELPEFVLAVAAGESQSQEPYRFELIQNVDGERAGFIIRQEKGASSLEEVASGPLSKKRIRMSLFVDVAAGRLAMALEGSDRVVETTIPPGKPATPAGLFRLTLLSGDVCLESLRVSEWTSTNPSVEPPSETRIVVREGSGAVGEVRSLDSESGTLVIAGKESETTVRLDEIDAIEFPGEPGAAGGEGVTDGKATIRLVGQFGGVLTGDLVSVSDQALRLTCRGITGSIQVPFTAISGIVVLAAAPPPALPARAGTLVMGDARVPGCIVDAAAWGGGLAWLPKGSLTASALAPVSKGNLSAVVEYVAAVAPRKESSGGQVEVGGVGASIAVDDDGTFIVGMVVEDGAAARDGRIMPGDRILAVRPTKEGPFVETQGRDLEAVMNLLRGRVGTSVGIRVETQGEKPRTVDLVRGLIYVADRDILDQALAAHAREGGAGHVGEGSSGYPAIVALGSGDLVPAAVERIDAKGIWLRSPVAAESEREAVAVADALVKAIELDPKAATKGIPRDRFERLLTVPRSQQSDPPTHLLRLRSGDYLRGKLLALDDKTVTFEVVGQKKQLPRDSVVRLIWLHPDTILSDDETSKKKVAPVTPDTPGSLLVQGLASGGQRTTIEAERVEGSFVIGRSPAFGPARIDTKRVDRLLLGRAIAESKEDLPFSKWKLKLAPQPRALRNSK
jgi:hypothetical protein